MDFSQKFGKNKNIVYREEDDGAFLFNPDTGNLKYMNRTGREIFLLLNEQKNLNQVIKNILGLFSDIDRRQIEEDLKNFVMELEQNDFLFPLNR